MTSTCIPRIPGKTLKHHEQLPHILEMQSGSGLVQYIERFARLTTMQLACQFHALSLAAGKRGSRLPKRIAPEPHIEKRLKLALDPGDVLKEQQQPSSTVMSSTSEMFLPL